MNDRKAGAPFLQALHHTRRKDLAALLDGLQPSVRAELEQIAEVRSVAAGQILIADNSVSQDVGYVLDGILSLRKTLPDGRTHIIGLLVPTDMYGRVFYGVSTYQVEALTDARVFGFARLPLERIMLQHPEVEQYFLANILDELDAMREWLLLLGTRKVISRVAAFLLILGRRKARQMIGAGKPPIAVHVPIRRLNLAEYLGTSVESLSRSLRSLERQSLIRQLNPTHFEILDLDGLIEAAGHDLIGRAPDSPQ